LLEHVAGEAGKSVRDAIDRFIFLWQAAWTEHGESEAGWPAYQALVQDGRRELNEAGAAKVMLDNEAPLYRGLEALILGRALLVPRPRVGAAAAPNPKAA